MTRHPATDTGRKAQTSEGWVGWRMYCDQPACDEASDTRPTEHHLPLSEFAAAGWFVAKVYGDTCPRCLAAGVKPTGEPHPLPDPIEDVPTGGVL